MRPLSGFPSGKPRERMCHYYEKTSRFDDSGRLRHCSRRRQRHCRRQYTRTWISFSLKTPCTQIGASGMDVGLPDGQMGNSEVGHTNIGAGRIVYQELTRITKSIQDGDFFENEALSDGHEQRQGQRQAPSTLWACCPTAACTATTPTCTPCWRWPSAWAWRRCIVHCFAGRPRRAPLLRQGLCARN